MKRLLLIALIICLAITLAGCGGNSAPAVQDNSKSAAEGNKEPAKDSSTETAKEPAQEITIKTGIGKEGGEVSVQTGEGLPWEAEKIGGLPKPEGITVIMAMDMTEILGQEYAYSYTVNGLTKEGFHEYTKLIAEKYPTVFQNAFTETEGSFMAGSADGKEIVLVAFNKDDASVIQYQKK